MTENTANPIEAGKMNHPRGLYTLFFTEMWERFSYYGMRSILVLAMVAAVSTGGLDLTTVEAGAVYGLYTGFVYLLCLPGGWVADRLLGMQRSVWWGGCIIALGHFTMAFSFGATTFFYLGLVFIIIGTGLLKPNVSTMVGELYPEGGARRDAGFSIYYMGINLGALFAPIICGTLGEKYGWHWGFAAAGIGMVFGLIQYRLTLHHLGDAGRYPSGSGDEAKDAAAARKNWTLLWGVVAVGVLVLLAVTFGLIPFPVELIAKAAAVAVAGIAALFFAYVYAFGSLSHTEKLHVGGIILFVLAAALFWSGFEQAGTTFNLFAENHTDLVFFGWQMPASWTQSINPVYIILLAPFFAALWINLARHNMNPSLPSKLALGLIQAGIGFVVMMFAARIAMSGEQASIGWLLLTYLFHTTGELCLSPIGLSAVTKLAPPRFESQMMGTWFMGASLGSIIAGLLTGVFTTGGATEAGTSMSQEFMYTAIFLIGIGVLMFLTLPWLKKLMGNVK